MDRKLLEAPQPERTTDSPVIEQKPGGGAIEKKGTGDTQESSSSISPQKPETATGNSIIGIVIIGAIFFFIVGGYVARIGMGQLEIAATPQLSTASTSSEQKDDSWSLRGRIQHSGNPVANALVWVIAADDLGNRYSSDSVRTNKDGTFRVDSIPLTLVQTPLSKKIEQAIVYATTDGFLNTVLWRKSGERVISLGKSSVGQLQSLSTKNLSEKFSGSKGDPGTGEMQQGEIVFTLLLPPDEQPSKAVHPGVRAFHHPAAGSVAGNLVLGLPFFTTVPNMSRIAPGFQGVPHGLIVVPLVQTQVLRLPCRRFWTLDHEGL
jgi:hypothetical protein